MSKSDHSEPSVDRLVHHLKEMTDELTALHGDLYWLAMQGQDASGKQSPAQLKVDLLTDLKGAVDNMRLLLWKYIETASLLDPKGVHDGLESQRLRRMTEFLQLLRDRLGKSANSEPVSFIERINARVDQSLADTKVA
jgi:hypothetical protein